MPLFSYPSMKNFTRLSFLLLSGTILMFSGCSKDDDTVQPSGGGPVANPERDAALQDYNTYYIGSNLSSSGWTGNSASCNAGSVPANTHQMVIQRINYFRRMVGLNDNCKLDTTLYAQQQATALLMTANNQLSHTPPNTWNCWTTSGNSGAASSNIALGVHSTGAVTAFIFDNGSGNEQVGHRRWILHSRKQTFSHGSTNNAMALHVFRNDTNSVVPSFIAYPRKGYMPQPLVPSRWSFSIPNANFSSATVSMNGPSGPVSLSVISTASGYGDNSIVWVPTGIDLSTTSDISYTVTVSGVGNAPQSTYTYTTVIFKP